MLSTQSNFDLISLHDAKVTKISREEDCISINLTFAFLCIGHPNNPFSDDSVVCLSPVLQFMHVEKEEAQTWDDETNRWLPHPDPGAPLDDEIMESRRLGDVFFLDGFHKAGWSEWRIWTSEFILNWEHSHPYHDNR